MAKVRLNLNLATKLMLNLGLLQLIFEENLQRHYILALFPKWNENNGQEFNRDGSPFSKTYDVQNLK